ncbi:uncharacterized protein LOC141611143 [Silene latifolia]|uniref:uncharacterized protein LOC141611143 n=1 Tax=Silene latifolia TaxID=37657 RepID=UPI003D771A15
MDPATTLAVIQTILAAIQTLPQLYSMLSFSHCKSKLDDLQNTVETVGAVLEDAGARQDPLNAQEKHYIQELKDAVYDADDVLDEFLTLAKQKQLREHSDKFSDKAALSEYRGTMSSGSSSSDQTEIDVSDDVFLQY